MGRKLLVFLNFLTLAVVAGWAVRPLVPHPVGEGPSPSPATTWWLQEVLPKAATPPNEVVLKWTDHDAVHFIRK
jgi:hypothetical protein